MRCFLLLRRHAVQLGEVPEVVVAGEALVDAALAAEDVADPLAHFARVLDDVVSEHLRRPGGRDQQRDQHLDRRGLSGAVRAEQAEKLALLDREADAADRLDVHPLAADGPGRRAVGAVEVDCLDDGHGLSLATRAELARPGFSIGPLGAAPAASAGVSIRRMSPGARSTVAFAGSARPFRRLRPGSPGPPPSAPAGAVARRSERIDARQASSASSSRTTPSPPRCRPLPPEPSRSSCRRTRSGYASSSASTGVVSVFDIVTWTPLGPSPSGHAP